MDCYMSCSSDTKIERIKLNMTSKQLKTILDKVKQKGHGYEITRILEHFNLTNAQIISILKNINFINYDEQLVIILLDSLKPEKGIKKKLIPVISSLSEIIDRQFLTNVSNFYEYERCAEFLFKHSFRVILSSLPKRDFDTSKTEFYNILELLSIHSNDIVNKELEKQRKIIEERFGGNIENNTETECYEYVENIITLNCNFEENIKRFKSIFYNIFTDMCVEAKMKIKESFVESNLDYFPVFKLLEFYRMGIINTVKDKRLVDYLIDTCKKSIRSKFGPAGEIVDIDIKFDLDSMALINEIKSKEIGEKYE